MNSKFFIISLVLAIALSSANSIAQETQKANATFDGVYAGELRGGQGCPQNGAVTQISVQGDDFKGTRKQTNGSLSRFEGKLQGSKFSTVTTDSRGNKTHTRGDVEAGKIELRLEQARCNYNAVLKKM